MRPPLPVDTLVKVTGCKEEQRQSQQQSETCGPGTFLLVKSPKLRKLPFLLGMMTDAGRSVVYMQMGSDNPLVA